jgi:hypothetical protein
LKICEEAGGHLSPVIREEVSVAESTSKHGKLKTTFEQLAEFAVSVTGDSVIIIMSDS